MMRDSEQGLAQSRIELGDDKAPAMLEFILIGVVVSGAFGLLSLSTASHDRLPPEAWREGDTSLPLAPADTDESNGAQRNLQTDRV
jgi:hypothetical protein